MTFNNSARTTGTYLSQWVKTATSGKVIYVGSKGGLGAGTGSLGFVCQCKASLYVDEASFGLDGDLIPTVLQQWVNQHRHRTNDNIRTKIENYIKAALSLSKIKSTYDVAEMSHVFTCRECAPSARTLVVHEDDFIANGGDRLRVPIGLTNWMIDHKHEKSLQEVIADVKPLLNLGQSYKVEKYDDFVNMPTVIDPTMLSGWGAYKANYNITSKPMSVSWPGGTISSSVKPFFLPPIFGPEKLTPKMPKELSSNQVSDTDTLKTFKGRKFRK